MPWRKTPVVTEEDQKLKFVSQVVHKERARAAHRHRRAIAKALTTPLQHNHPERKFRPLLMHPVEHANRPYEKLRIDLR